MIKTKKSQEEMIGFVLIIILVAVIALIFLWFSIKPTNELSESREINDFLQASLYLQTPCSNSLGNLTIKELLEACYNNQNCDTTPSCSILDSSYSSILDASFNYPNKISYLSFQIYSGNETTKTSFVSIKQGNSSKRQGSDIILPISDQNIHLNLEIAK